MGSDQLHRRHRLAGNRIVVALLAWSIACADRNPEVHGVADLSLQLITTSRPVPLSENNGLALVGTDTACLFDSYEAQIVCGDREWARPYRIGRFGKGPGELGSYGTIVRGPGASVAFFDVVNRRMSVFGMNGTITQYPMPVQVSPASAVPPDTTLVAHMLPAPGSEPSLQIVWIRGAVGTADSTVTLRFDPGVVGGASVVVSSAVLTPTGEYVAHVRRGDESYLARYSTAAEFVSLIELPRVEPHYPNDTDVEEYVRGRTRAFLGRAPSESVVDAFRRRPLPRLPRNSLRHTVQFDASGRMWVLEHPRGGTTSVNVFRGAEYLGTIELRGRVRAIQITGSDLVALTDEVAAAPMTMADVEAQRRLVWYRIADS